jgi:hypothetical protein
MSGIAATAAKQHGVFSHAQALAAGMTRSAIHHRLATGDWVRVFPGVYRLAGAPQTWAQRLMAAALWAGACEAGGPVAAVSHRAAAALLGLEGFQRKGIEVSTLRKLAHPPETVVCHRVAHLPGGHVTTRLGIPVTSADRLLLDLAPTLEVARLERLVDEVLRMGLASRLRIAWTVGHSQARGRVTLKQIIDVRLRDYVPPDGELEALFLSLVLEWGFKRPVGQHEIHGLDFEGRVDYLWPEEKVAVELQGFIWHRCRHRWRGDITKRNILTGRGWTVFQFTWEDLTEHPDFVHECLSATLGTPALPSAASLAPAASPSRQASVHPSTYSAIR